MSLMKQFPIDTIKIDRSFVRDLSHDSEDQAIAQAIISMGKALGMTVIAEGVETDAERALLKYVKVITEAAYRSTPEDVQKLRDAGWEETQISEAVYVVALFAMFNRIANAFGVPVQNYVAMGKTTP
jgi:predicted signal transduction protein with EAL and GGDEF domain